ncbi:hypothetical protein GCM10007415_31280 [Parapedobacter pyrenivorans]|uniref:Uncharacterized protein n=1 Tax=Parapedobacter pyrenivorans TaxID=1305674 RepID=A0A917HYA4_9SPHI|nr:hypothetical protein [Parapedobacter pyrenivorans]GGG93989.1 hypothetical protein GCM10007415_31280 [Parapedobacter pyrenivorans]
MKTIKETVELPEAEKPTLYDRIKGGLAMASQLIIASPLKLPPKVVAVAKYMALALGILDAVTAANQKREDGDESE